MMQAFKFVGGTYDGDSLPVAQPVRLGIELRVKSLDPKRPSEFYVYREDGCFHLESKGMTPDTARREQLN
jgi:hypothetical protein